MAEELVKVPNHSKYAVTRDGKVYTYKQRPGWIKGSTDKLGYQRIDTTNDYGKRTNLYLHQILAQTFIPNPKNKPHVNHIDNNPSNNSLDNLEWCTHLENMQHSARQGRRPSLKGEANPTHKYTESIVRQVRRMYKEGHSQMDIKRLLGIPQPTISVMVRKAQWRHI